MSEKILLLVGYGVLSPKYDVDYQLTSAALKYGSIAMRQKWPGWGSVAEFYPGGTHTCTVQDILAAIAQRLPDYKTAVVVINEETKQFQLSLGEGFQQYEVAPIWQSIAAKYPPPPPMW